MSISQQHMLRVQLAVAVLALVAGVAVGRYAAARPSEPPVSPKRADVRAVRYKVPVSASQPARGPEDAMVTLVHWCDLRDARCTSLAPVLDQLLEQYAGRVRLVFRHLIDPRSTDSQMAAEFSMVAFAQAGKFWQARELLARDKSELTPERLTAYAAQLGLEPSAVKSDIDKHGHAGHIIADAMFAGKFGVTQVPAIFVNGRPVAAPLTRASIAAMIDGELEGARALVQRGVAPRDVYAELTKDGLWGANVAK